MRLKLTKGLNLRLAGGVQDTNPVDITPRECAVVPDDFQGFIPKLMVKEGDHVEIGSPVMHDKNTPDICLVAPVSGTVKAVVRGDRRKVMRVVIENDRQYTQLQFDTKAPFATLMGKSGLFSLIRRRPYDIVPALDVRPRDIFITALDTAPLALPLTSMLGADRALLGRAVMALKTLTDGKVYLCVGDDWTLGDITGAEMVTVSGPHPAGNPGIQIANIAPVNKGENVWTLDVVTLERIGKLLATGRLDSQATLAVVGSEVAKPTVVRTRVGADVASIVEGLIKDTEAHKRVISGNVLTGIAVGTGDDAFLRYPYRQVTVIANGDDVDEFMGWANMSPAKISISRALPFHGLRRFFSPDARLQGGRRAMIMSGEYDRVLPADIMAEYLIKAIIGRNIDDMEALGIYEVAPEDLALCEFVDTSKLPIQQIVRNGLDYLRKELE